MVTWQGVAVVTMVAAIVVVAIVTAWRRRDGL